AAAARPPPPLRSFLQRGARIRFPDWVLGSPGETSRDLRAVGLLQRPALAFRDHGHVAQVAVIRALSRTRPRRHRKTFFNLVLPPALRRTASTLASETTTVTARSSAFVFGRAPTFFGS